MTELHQITQAAQALAQARHIVCLTGAGVSAESGVATFRDAQTGLWARFDPQRLASQEGFADDPGLVWRWYSERLRMVEAATPNPGHRALARLQELTPAFTLVTQNVDDLHERAGSQQVQHIHGRIHIFRCNYCRAEHALQPSERTQELPPICLACGDQVRPDVVWFGEALPESVVEIAWRAAEVCDIMLVVGNKWCGLSCGRIAPASQTRRHHRDRCQPPMQPDLRDCRHFLARGGWGDLAANRGQTCQVFGNLTGLAPWRY